MPADGPPRGTLYLIPTPLAHTPLEQVLPQATRRIAAGLTHFVVERAKTARAFLKHLGTTTPLQQLQLVELNQHTPASALPGLLAPLLAGHDVGLLSEAGCPGVADPGAELVRLAHDHGITVRPLVGPSAILLALMASGLIGQRFSFHGYLPVKAEARAEAARLLERRAAADNATQVCIETPYRNHAMLDTLRAVCRPDTWLTVACDLTGAHEYIRSARLADWPADLPDLSALPCIFLIGRN